LAVPIGGETPLLPFFVLDVQSKDIEYVEKYVVIEGRDSRVSSLGGGLY
jgi:hypothetical protein